MVLQIRATLVVLSNIVIIYVLYFYKTYFTICVQTFITINWQCFIKNLQNFKKLSQLMKTTSVYNIKLIGIAIGGNLMRLLFCSFLDLMILSIVIIIIIIIRIGHRCRFQTRNQLLGRIKYSIGLLWTNDATLGLLVLRQRTFLAEVMFAPARKRSRIISTISIINQG